MPIVRKPKANAGLLGLGIIGSRVASSLRHRGFQTYVWNRTPKSEPNFLGSPAEIAETCEIIQLFVADAVATMAMIDAMAEQLTPHHVILSHGTIGLAGTLEASKRVRDHGAQFLDAPFTGSKVAAENGQLVYYLGGPESAVTRARPMLEASSKAILYVGEVGQAAVVKIATNLISAATVQVLAEAIALTVKAGVPAQALVQAIEQNAMRSGVTDLKLPKMIARDYEPHFSLKHMFKDVQLGVQLANQMGLDLPASTTIAGTLNNGVRLGWGELDYAALAKHFEDGGKPQG